MSDSSSTPELLGSTEHRSSAIRRVVLPLLVITVAGVILIWGRQTEERDLREVDAAVQKLAYELFHAPIDGPLPDKAREMGATHAMADRIQQVFENHDWNRVRVEVRSGDTSPPFGDGRATHHAIIFINHRRELGLRLLHQDDADQTIVLGYWVPDAAGSP